MSTFLGHDSTFWSGIEALAVCIYTTFVIVTLLFIYHQVRIAARTFRFQAIQSIQGIVASFEKDRKLLIDLMPIDLALTAEQFPSHAPSRRTARFMTEEESVRTELTKDQSQLLGSLGQEPREVACRVIGRLNDIGELIEDAAVSKKSFLGKYHFMVIRCCSLIEAVRRDEERRRGGNYGQRLLRMRQWATTYNDIFSKHRETLIYIAKNEERKLIYQSPSPTLCRKAKWALRRWLRRY